MSFHYLASAFCPANTSMFAKVVAASRSSVSGDVIHTIQMRLPRIVWAEVLTHRVFSRNGRSSRAVPVNTMLNEVRTDPFVPWHWTGAQKGMQGVAGWDEPIIAEGMCHFDMMENAYDPISAEKAWLWARDKAAQAAEAFLAARYHKQIANRLLEPFSWIDVVVTSTQWANFEHLRDHEDTEPHLQDLARLICDVMARAHVTDLKPGEWHLPYIVQEDRDHASRVYKRYDDAMDFLRRISAARCARISYVPFDGNASYPREIERYDSLVRSDRIHASPLEHQATPDTQSFCRTVTDFGDGVIEEIEGLAFDNADFHGNLKGFIQARKMVPGEFVHG